MKILLTGGSGFLGRSFLQAAIDEKCHVVNLVRSPKSLDNEILWDFFTPLPALPEVDAIVHLAFSSIGDASPLVYVQNTIPVTYLAQYAADNDIPVYYASSIGVHGDLEFITPSSSVSPKLSYSKAKLIGETIVKNCAKEFAIFRIAGIYGLHGPSHLGLNKAITNAKMYSEQPTLYGNGGGMRNYISVNCAAKWILHDVVNKKTMTDVGYVAGKEIMSLYQWLENVRRIFIPSGKIIIREGISDKHQIVQPSQPPIQLIPFKEYLEKL